MPAAPRLLDAGLPAPARGVFTTTALAAGAAGAGNLSRRAGEPVARVQAARDQLAHAVDLTRADLAFAEQVHGAGVAVVAAAPVEADRVTGRAGVDALVTRRPGTGLVVFAADCMPVLLADPVAGVVAAAHAGRPGLLAGVLEATVAAMVEQGAEPARTLAVVGPCIGGCCYELPAAVVRELDDRLPGIATTTRWGTPAIDLRTGAEAVLTAAGLATVRHVGGCTYEQPDLLFSYRRDGTTHRHGGLVVLT